MKQEQIKKLKEEIAERNDKIDVIGKSCDTENRYRTPEEKTEWEKLADEVKEREDKLADAKVLNERTASLKARELEQKAIAAAASGGKTNEGEVKDLNKIGRKFRITRAIHQVRSNSNLEGVEAEMYQESEKEARETGNLLEGNVAIPEKFVKILRKKDYLPNGEKRDFTVGTEGADVVDLDLRGLIPILAPDPILGRMGATIITGLRGDLQFPRHNGAVTLTWEGETDAGTEVTPTTDNVKLTPNRLGGFTDISQTMIRQSSFDSEQFVRGELERALAEALDIAGINGAGSGNEPLGLLGQSIGTSDIGTNGGAATFLAIKGNYQNVESANAGREMAALTHPQIKYELMGIPKQGSGVEGNFIINDQNNPLPNVLGFPVFSSTNVPNDLTKGTGTALSAYIVGVWSELLMGQWGGIDLIVDPFTQATNGLLRIVINGYFDVDVRHAASFSATDDISVV